MIAQNCHSSDICEHHFTNCWGKNNSFNKAGIDSAAANGTNYQSHAFSIDKNKNISGNNV